MSNKRKITKIVACLFLVALLTVAVFGAISSAADTEGRTFKGYTKAASQSERLELAKPLEEVPLTFEATI
ncbi:MAG: hypothetical protein IJY18_06605 [Clostridia bacterium]|nr:hypothetical protein [Clostridia bacterium]